MKKLLLLLIPFLFISCASLRDIAYEPNYQKYTETDEEAKKSTIYSNYDKYTGATFYHNKKTRSSDPIQMYIGQLDSNKFLRCYVHYSGEDWIFFDKIYMVNRTDNRYSASIRFYDKDTDVKDGRVYESVDYVLNDDEIKILKELLNGTKTNLKLSGNKYREYTLSDNNITAMREIIEFYESL